MANKTPLGFQLVQATTHRPILSQIVSLSTPSSSVREVIISQLLNVSCRLYHACAAAKKTSNMTSNMKEFMIRNLNRDHFSSLQQLRKEVLRQLSNVVSEISDMGYMKGATTKVCINSQDDLLDVWHIVERVCTVV